MEDIPLLKEIATVAGAAVIVSVVASWLRIPTVAGLLIAGALIGPHAFALVDEVHAIEVIAEVGVVLLLFTIGLEFSLARLKHIFQTVALGGVLQVGGTFALVFVVARALGIEDRSAVFFGFAVALSSTAIVLRALTERRELDAPHGRFIVGTLIFQDLCVVPMVLIVPLLGSASPGGGAGDDVLTIGWALGKAALVVIGVLGLSRLVVPLGMKWVEASRSREVFLLAVLSLCVGTAWLTSLSGLSLALGAFLGGIVVAETEYSHRAMSDILPLRYVFVSFFFVSLGMLFDIRVVVERPIVVLLLILGLTIGKGAIATLAAMAMRFPPRAAWLAGVGLAQFGEFGFVLVRMGVNLDVVTRAEVDPLLAAGILSMFLTPLLLQAAPNFTAGERMLAPLAKLLKVRSVDDVELENQPLNGHVVVVGYGVAGRLVATNLRNLEVEHLILELNAENVRHGRERGDPVFHADATSAEALGHAHIAEARCVVLMINDLAATRRVVSAIAAFAPEVPLVVRTHYAAEREGFLTLGARRVVVEELEGGIEVLTQVMRELGVPRNIIEIEIEHARIATELSAREGGRLPERWADNAALSALRVDSVVVLEKSAAVGQSLRDLDLRAALGVTVVALQRGDNVSSEVGPDEKLQVGDIAFLVGEPDALRGAVRMLGAPRED